MQSDLWGLITVVVLFMIWLRLGSIRDYLAMSARAKVGEALQRIDYHLEDIAQRVCDNFETDQERQDRIDSQP